MTKDGVVPVPTNTEVPFNAAIEKGYWPNIRLRYGTILEAPAVRSNAAVSRLSDGAGAGV